MKKTKNIPALRFPGFRDEWAESRLSQHIEEYRAQSTTVDQYPVLTSSRSGLSRQDEYFGENRLTERDNTGFNVLPPGHITYRSRSDDRNFYFNENALGITGIVSVYYPVFRMKAGSNKFLVELLAKNSHHIGKYAVGTSQTVLSYNELGRIKLHLPAPKEQKKIADFLTAIDTKIAQLEKKKKLLERYKSAFLSDIQSGKLTFSNSEQWTTFQLGKLVDCLDSLRRPLNSAERADIPGPYPYYGANTQVDSISKYLFDEPLILLAEDGGNFDEFATRPIAQSVRGKCWVNNHAHVLRARSDIVDHDYLFQMLVNKDIRRFINGTSRSKLNQSDMMMIEVSCPSFEQQKRIGKALSKLQQKIADTENQLRHLRQYRSGLLQSLFV